MSEFEAIRSTLMALSQVVGVEIETIHKVRISLRKGSASRTDKSEVFQAQLDISEYSNLPLDFSLTEEEE